jgi:hypothetical protein
MERPITLSRHRSIESQVTSMSPEVRHAFPTLGPHVCGRSMPHSQRENTIGRPVAFRASLHCRNTIGRHAHRRFCLNIVFKTKQFSTRSGCTSAAHTAAISHQNLTVLLSRSKQAAWHTKRAVQLPHVYHHLLECAYDPFTSNALPCLQYEHGLVNLSV